MDTGQIESMENLATPVSIMELQYRKQPVIVSIFFSIGIDWTKIKTNSAFLKTLFTAMTFIKLPFPALEFSSAGNIEGIGYITKLAIKLNRAIMKKTILLFIIFIIALNADAQYPKGTVITDSLYSKNLENEFGENPTRAIAVYLPPGYDESAKRYPVIYFLHGFTGNERMMNYTSRLLDYAIATNRIRPFIMVIPNEQTTYDGSFYSNSGVFGNWEDFTAYDLVEYMDRTYRTIPNKDSRGITGHSMGGYGAIKIAMKHP